MDAAGEPRSVTDPANQQFLDAVVRGECPAELAQGGQEPVHVNLLRSAFIHPCIACQGCKVVSNQFRQHCLGHSAAAMLAQAGQEAVHVNLLRWAAACTSCTAWLRSCMPQPVSG